MAEDVTEFQGAVAVLASCKAESGVSQAQIADACGVSKAGVNHWLQGRAIPNADTWICAIRACGFEVVVQPMTDDIIVEHHEPR